MSNLMKSSQYTCNMLQRLVRLLDRLVKSLEVLLNGSSCRSAPATNDGSGTIFIALLCVSELVDCASCLGLKGSSLAGVVLDRSSFVKLGRW